MIELTDILKLFPDIPMAEVNADGTLTPLPGHRLLDPPSTGANTMTCEYTEYAEFIRTEAARIECERQHQRMTRLADACADLTADLVALASGEPLP